MRIRQIAAVAGAALIATMFASGPAAAQKSKDTLRYAVGDAFANISSYCSPVQEVGNFARRIYMYLVQIDEYEKKFVPGLAKSWTRIAPDTVEFELRDDVKFHNGNKFDADDVVRTVEFLQDPNIPLQNKVRYGWIKKVEKLGPYKIRVQAQKPNVTDMAELAYRIQIQDAEAYDSLPAGEKCDYGRLTPYGTGPYKIVSIDKNKGVAVERYDDFKGDPKYLSAPIKRIEGIPIPDRQTQVAQMLTGGIDLVQDIPVDIAESLKNNPNITISEMPAGTFIYIMLDAAGRSGNKPLTDPRVRRAIFMALDRPTIIKNIVPGGKSGAAQPLMSFCFKTDAGCAHTIDPPKYDPEGAKKLLAEAGYPNGFDLTYDVFNPIKDVGVAIAGELLKVGIRATVNPVTIAVFYKKWSGGESNMISVNFPDFLFPDADVPLKTFFYAAGDYSQDPVIHNAVETGTLEFDPKKREAIYSKAFDRINEQSYAIGFSSMPMVFALSKEVEVKRDPLSAGAYFITDYHWK